MGGGRRDRRPQEIAITVGGNSAPEISTIAVVAAVLAACLSAPQVRAQADYPNRPIRLIVGYPAGTMADVSTRVLTNRMSQTLGQQIVVENRPGAGRALPPNPPPARRRTATRSTSAPRPTSPMPGDGSEAAVRHGQGFRADCAHSVAAVVLVVHPSVGVAPVNELVALARSKPGEINYASVGIGSARISRPSF